MWVRLGEQREGVRAGEPQEGLTRGGEEAGEGARLGGNLGSLIESNLKRCEAVKAKRDG